MCFREACETALKEKHLLDDTELEGFTDEVHQSNLEQLEAVSRVFRTAGEADIPTDVSYLSPYFLKLNATLFSSRDGCL